MANKEYLKNLKENWILLVPQGFLTFIFIVLVGNLFNGLNKLIENIPDSYAKLLAVIIIVVGLFKIVTWLGFDGFTEYGNTWIKVMEGNKNQN